MSRTRFGSRLKKAISAWPRPRARHARAARQRGGPGTASASAVREARAGRGRAPGGEEEETSMFFCTFSTLLSVSDEPAPRRVTVRTDWLRCVRARRLGWSVAWLCFEEEGLALRALSFCVRRVLCCRRAGRAGPAGRAAHFARGRR